MDLALAPLRADSIGIYIYEPKLQRPAEIYFRGVPERFIFEYEQLARDHDPLLERVLQTRAAVRDEDVYPGEAWNRSFLYREFVPRYRTKHVVAAPIIVSNEVVGTLHIGRFFDEGRFTTRDKETATAICRALAKQCGTETSAYESDPAPRLHADRARLRTQLEAIERTGKALPEDQTAMIFDMLKHNQIAPIDCLDNGERRYVLLPRFTNKNQLPVSLTARERAVLRYVVRGESNKAIASELHCSVSAVGNKVSAIMHKFGVSSRIQLIVLAAAHASD
jgi:DNA-binding CsgD family transcriptional regulator